MLHVPIFRLFWTTQIARAKTFLVSRKMELNKMCVFSNLRVLASITNRLCN